MSWEQAQLISLAQMCALSISHTTHQRKAIPVLLAPAVMPVLPPAVYGHIYGKSGNAESQQDAGGINGLPQALADRFGWEQQVALIAQVYHSLPIDEQRLHLYLQLWRGWCARAIRWALSSAPVFGKSALMRLASYSFHTQI